MASLINKCLFPVAGRGTRFLPITKAIPKELLPVVDKPLLQFGVEEAYAASIQNMLMIISQDKIAIREYLCAKHDRYTKKEQLALSELQTLMNACRFDFCYQHQMRGLGDAIRCGKELVAEDDFAVLLPDDLCSMKTLAEMITLYKRYDCCVVAVEQVASDNLHRYGVVKTAPKPLDTNVYRVTDMVEKPRPNQAPSNLGVIGRYILSNDLLAILEDIKPGVNGEVQLTDALKIKAQQGQLIAYTLPSRRYDCGTAQGLVEAINAYSDFN